MSRRDVLAIANFNTSSSDDQVAEALHHIETSFLDKAQCMLLKSKEDCGYAIDAIGDLLKASPSHSLVARGASCIAAMAHSCPERRRQLVLKGICSRLLPLCYPYSGDSACD